MSNNGKWVINLVEDGVWDSTEEFDTREEAIKYGKKNFDELYEEENGETFDTDNFYKAFYVGQIKRYVPSICTDSVIERMVDTAYDEVGEVAETFLESISKQEFNFLDERLNEVLMTWLDETDNHPLFWQIINVKEVKV